MGQAEPRPRANHLTVREGPLLDHLRRFLRRRTSPGDRLFVSIASRIPPGGEAGLLPLPEPALAQAEIQLGERHVRELHAWGARPPGGLGRRARAVAAAASRGRAAELEEALDGLLPWDASFLLEEMEKQKEVSLRALAATCRKLLREAGSWEALAGAICLLTPSVAPEDEETLLLLGRSPALTASCATALEPLGPPALLSLARVTTGLGRAMALERLGLVWVSAPSVDPQLLGQAIELAGAIDDPTARAYAAVPLLEIPSLVSVLEDRPSLAVPTAACIEATSRGGWHGGPGPGLGRLPGALAAAGWILGAKALDRSIRERVAQAILEAHPMPVGAILEAAQKALARGDDDP